MKQKRIPMRMCLGCKEMKPKRELIRVVKNNEGEISLDFTGKKAGRGAYVCKDIACLREARKKRSFERAFSCRIEEPVYQQLEQELNNYDE